MTTQAVTSINFNPAADGSTGKSDALKKRGLHYGHLIIAGCFVCGIISNGTGLSVFGIFIKVLQDDMGWSRTDIMTAYALFVLAIGTTSPFIGRIVDRRGARAVLAAGSLATSLGLLTFWQMERLWHFHVGNLLLGAGTAATGPLTLSFIISNWFVRHRGRAIGIMSMGVSLSAVAFAPLIAVRLLPELGLKPTYLALALINAGVLLPLAAFLIRTRPADMGLPPDGGAFPAKRTGQTAAPTAGGLSLKAAVATPAFWLLGLYLVMNHSYMGVLQSMFPHLADLGFPPGIGATALGLISICATFGMFFFGWLCDRLPVRHVAAAGLGTLATGISLLICVGPQAPAGFVFLHATIMGFGVGCWLPALSMLAGRTFGMAHYGAVYGLLSLFQHIGGAGGPLLAGYVFDATGSYHRAFFLILLLQLLAMPVVLSVKTPRQTPPDFF